jgi:hypothetical protein
MDLLDSGLRYGISQVALVSVCGVARVAGLNRIHSHRRAALRDGVVVPVVGFRRFSGRGLLHKKQRTLLDITLSGDRKRFFGDKCAGRDLHVSGGVLQVLRGAYLVHVGEQEAPTVDTGGCRNATDRSPIAVALDSLGGDPALAAFLVAVVQRLLDALVNRGGLGAAELRARFSWITGRSLCRRGDATKQRGGQNGSKSCKRVFERTFHFFFPLSELAAAKTAKRTQRIATA